MEVLKDQGVLVLDGPKGLHLCDPLQNVLKDQRELVGDNVVLGGFGALGNPSSFHHPDIRFIRRYIYDFMKPKFEKIYGNYKIEMLFDRLCIRVKGRSISKEQWHRDVCPTKEDSDVVLGGWINLGPVSQFFSGVPKTHRDSTEGEGFHRTQLSPKDKPVLYEVKPGQIILFYQNLLHEVKPGTIKQTSYKLFLGWRFTHSEKPLYDSETIIQEQRVPPLPSGQIPPMYAKLHAVNHKQKLLDFSKQFISSCVDPKTQYVYRFLPSLKELGLEFKPYSESEKEIFFPQNF